MLGRNSRQISTYNEAATSSDDGSLTAEDRAALDGVRRRAVRQLAGDAAKALTVAVMGATGVGKSSLINALFDTRLPTDPVRPCTTQPTTVHVTGTRTRHPLIFVDLPGFGEGVDADAGYLAMYLNHLRTSDVVIWAIHADSRNLADDQLRIRQLIEATAEDERAAIVNRIVVVLTKADQLHLDPWILPIHADQPADVRTQPGPATRALLDAKCRYAYEQVLAPFAEYLRPSTYSDGGPTVEDGPLAADEFTVRLRRPITESEALRLKAAHPGLALAIDRLIASLLPQSCSAQLRYDLASVLTRVVDRLDPSAIRRLAAHVDVDGLDRQSTSEALNACNIMVLDVHHGRPYRFSDMAASALARTAAAGASA